MHSKTCSTAPFICQCWGVIHCKYFKAVDQMFCWSIWNAGFNQAKIIFRPDAYFAWDSQAFYQSPRMIRRPIIKSCFNGIAWWFISRRAFHIWKHTGSAVIKQQKITLTSSLSYGYQNVYFNYVLTPWQSKVFHPPTVPVSVFLRDMVGCGRFCISSRQGRLRRGLFLLIFHYLYFVSSDVEINFSLGQKQTVLLMCGLRGQFIIY